MSSSAGDYWVVGVVLGLLGSVAINTGNNIQSLGLKRLREEYEAGPGAKPSKSRLGRAKTVPAAGADGNGYGEDGLSSSSQCSSGAAGVIDKDGGGGGPPGPVTSKIWVTGTFIFVSGSLLNFASYAFAAQSMLASLESIQFVTNLLFGKFMLGANVTKTMLLGTCLTVVGTILAVQFSSKNTLDLNTAEIKLLYSNPAYLAYLALMVTLLVLLDVLYRFLERRKCLGRPLRWSDVIMPVAYSVWSALFGTQSVVQAKLLAELLSLQGNGEEDIFRSWFTYATLIAWLATVSVWLKRLNDALAKFNPLFIIPLLQCSFIFFAIISGGIFFKEFNDFTPHQWVGFWCGVGVMFSGLTLLTPKKRRMHDELAREVVSLLATSDAVTIQSAGIMRPPLTPPSTPRGGGNEIGRQELMGEQHCDNIHLLEEGRDTGRTDSESPTTQEDSEEAENDVGEEVSAAGGSKVVGNLLRSHRNTREKLSKAMGEAMKEVMEETTQMAVLLFTPHNGTAALTSAMVDATIEKEKKMRMKEDLNRLRKLLSEHPPGHMGGFGEDVLNLIRKLEIDIHLIDLESESNDVGECSSSNEMSRSQQLRESLHTMFSPRTFQEKVLKRATELEENMGLSPRIPQCRPTECVEDPSRAKQLKDDLNAESDVWAT